MRQRHTRQLAFVRRRMRPGQALGLSLTVELLVLAAAGWMFGVILQDVLAARELARVDRPITRYLVQHREPWLTTTLRIGTQLGSTTVLVPLTAIVGILAYRRARTWRPLLILGSALSGSVLLYSTVKVLVGRPRPRVGPLIAAATGYSFPSGHVTQSVAVYGALAVVATPLLASWRKRVLAWAVTSLIVAVIAFSRVYLGVHWSTDVLGAFALGSAWLAAVVTATDAARRPPLQTAVSPPVPVGSAATDRHGPHVPADPRSVHS